jgi:hypothetical protein
MSPSASTRRARKSAVLLSLLALSVSTAVSASSASTGSHGHGAVGALDGHKRMVVKPRQAVESPATSAPAPAASTPVATPTVAPTVRTSPDQAAVGAGRELGGGLPGAQPVGPRWTRCYPIRSADDPFLSCRPSTERRCDTHDLGCSVDECHAFVCCRRGVVVGACRPLLIGRSADLVCRSVDVVRRAHDLVGDPDFVFSG